MAMNTSEAALGDRCAVVSARGPAWVPAAFGKRPGLANSSRSSTTTVSRVPSTKAADGVGKTATAVNFASLSAAAGYRTLLCDLDPQGASGFYFRVKPSKQAPGVAAFAGGERIAQAIRASDYDNLDVLPASADYRDFDIFLSRLKNKRSRLKKLLRTTRGDYQVVILD